MNHNKFRFKVLDRSKVREYLKHKNVEVIKDNIMKQIKEKGLENVDLVSIAKSNKDSAILIKELAISNQIDNTELANQIARDIISKIEQEVDMHLENYQKFTLNSLDIDSNREDDLKSQFFSLISLLKDVSVLGRKLLEMAPHFNWQKTPLVSTGTNNSTSTAPNSPIIGDNTSLHSASKLSMESRRFINQEEDATSEDLLAALIESSSTDDFLVLSSSSDSIQPKDMILEALIYIKSHECFTLSHDIQGVAMVLRRIKFFILNILAPKNQVELITKLLTSIGRYNEMNYVFDLLRDRNQFEVLLSKGVEKTPALRIALFNYVKKNPEFYALVTLNFSMFREIAESLEANALKRLDKMKSKSKILQETRPSNKEMDNKQTPSTTIDSNSILVDQIDKTIQIEVPKLPGYLKESLNLCLVELVDASDCYTKAGCYKKSNNCERKAKLVALQIALLPEGVNVLDVKESELTDLITSFKCFEEAFIVADAHDCQLAWRQALFKQVILEGQIDYLKSFCQKCDFSSALVEELSLLYKQYVNGCNNTLDKCEEKNISKRMALLISQLSNVEFKYNLYNQLNLESPVNLDEGTEAFLKDLKLV